MSFCFFGTLFIDIIDGKIAQIFDILTPSKQDIDEAKEYKEFYESSRGFSVGS